MDVVVGCQLRYTVAEPTAFVLQVQPAKADGQSVLRESLVLPAGPASKKFTVYTNPVTWTRVVRTILGPGTIDIRYEATIDIDAASVDPAQVDEFNFTVLPMENLEYLAPSRYCPSDTFTEFAHDTFGGLPRGHARVVAICNWIFSNIRYESGSTGPNSTAADVFQSKAGVCRDFAHLGISLCRAAGIPARYASVYADALSPQDFHAVFQAYLNGPMGGAWYTFDASRMASVDAVVRIAAGRDAADVAFAWPQGEVQFDPPVVWVEAKGRSASARTTLAVGK